MISHLFFHINNRLIECCFECQWILYYQLKIISERIICSTSSIDSINPFSTKHFAIDAGIGFNFARLASNRVIVFWIKSLKYWEYINRIKEICAKQTLVDWIHWFHSLYQNNLFHRLIFVVQKQKYQLFQMDIHVEIES